MKKLLAVVLILELLISMAFAEGVDISGLSYDELVTLRDRINMAIWQSDEWQEVMVPQGVWKVGEDIPAGHWTVKCAPKWFATEISWGESLSENGEEISWRGKYSVYNYVYNPDYEYYEEGMGVTEYSFEVVDGDYIVVSSGSAIFMPYAGKPSLGFK